ncbi:hypothetical protein AVEN_263126-1 [Araneus ventricosus]|uniref:Uncharacterized protein n=1 Tax=Araneus ventricosus TaxID=182803 RepID=A0A4Y2F9Y8_ARAVE|nr:hypothetical protein AVEN_263126-1 [Araneus ventricosus]
MRRRRCGAPIAEKRRVPARLYIAPREPDKPRGSGELKKRERNVAGCVKIVVLWEDKSGLLYFQGNCEENSESKERQQTRFMRNFNLYTMFLVSCMRKMRTENIIKVRKIVF